MNNELDKSINLLKAIELCDEKGITQVILSEIKEGGFGQDLHAEAEANNGAVTLENLVQYLFV